MNKARKSSLSTPSVYMILPLCSCRVYGSVVEVVGDGVLTVALAVRGVAEEWQRIFWGELRCFFFSGSDHPLKIYFLRAIHWTLTLVQWHQCQAKC